jgi:hypothetical protein
MALLLTVIVIATAACAPTAEERQSVAAEQMAGLRLSAAAGSVVLAATKAFHDPGIVEGIRFVKVRIIDRLELRVRIEAAGDVVFAEDPQLCLVGPDSAPDDAGLENGCWGEPDLSSVATGQWQRTAQGQPIIRAAQPIEFSVQLERGTDRCDYPPGDWTLELKGRPITFGSPAEPIWAPDGEFDIPIGPDQPLPYLTPSITRYCGLATLDGGEPEILD